MSSAAVLFGIDYLGTKAALRGCANDVRNMSEYLASDLKYENIRVYTEQDTPTKVTGQSIVRILCKLAMNSHAMKLERVWIHFSGHGVGIVDRSGDEVDGMDEAICPVDFETGGIITDDTIKKILRYFHKDTRVTCVFDCCHSGTIGDLKYRYSGSTESTVENKDYPCPAHITLISGCRDDQTSADAYNVSNKHEFSGAMTSCLLQCIKYRRLVNETVPATVLVNDVTKLLQRKRFSQRPVLTSSREIKANTIII